MARKALFATNDQPARQSNENRLDGNSGNDVAVSVGGDGGAEAASKRPVVVQQSPEQRRAALGIEVELVEALQERADDETIDKWLKEQAICCGELTLQKLTHGKHISGAEAQTILESYSYYVEDVKAGANILDILAFHIWVKLDNKGERAEREIRSLTAHLSNLVPTGATHCAFSRLCETPIELFEKFPLAEKICNTLMCPIVLVNERDFVSVASVNPITAATAGALLEVIMEREGVRPFSFVLTMVSSSWAQLCEKQFGIEI